MASNLRAFLFTTYDGFSDKRCKDLDKNHPFKVDDREDGDVAVDFCDIFVSVPDMNKPEFELSLQNCPHNAEVQQLIADNGGKITAGPAVGAISFCIQLNVKEGSFVNKLARAIKHVIGRGQSYEVPNWRWIAPRTAKSLTQLARRLSDFQKVP
jgi:hypothetical protein